MEIDFFKFAPLYPSSKSSSRLRSSMILQNSWNLFQPWDFEWVYQILHNFAKAHKKENTNDTISEKLPNLVQKSGDSAKSFWKLENVQRCKNLWMSQTSVSVLNDLLMCWKWKGHKGAFQKPLSGFCPLRGVPPPHHPLSGKSFCQKTLSKERGVSPPPLNGKSFCQKTLSGKGGYTPSPS